MIATSVSSGNPSLERKSRRGELAASIQYDLVGFEAGKTMIG